MATGFAARVREVEATLERTEQTLDHCEATAARVREALAHDNTSGSDWHTVIVRESSPAWARAVGNALLGHAPERTTPVRETNAQPEAKAFADEWGDRVFAESGCPLTWADLAAVEAIERESRARRAQPRTQRPAGAGLVQHWDKATGSQP